MTARRPSVATWAVVAAMTAFLGCFLVWPLFEGLRGALTEGLKKCLTGKAAMPETQEAKALELKRVAGPFLDEKQLEILSEAAGCGMRAMPNEE